MISITKIFSANGFFNQLDLFPVSGSLLLGLVIIFRMSVYINRIFLMIFK
jgi:hypothetical protein